MVGRKANIEYPKVWMRFEKTLKDGTVKKFKIQDITEDMYSDAVKFMSEFYLQEEAMTIASGILKNQQDMEQLYKFWRNRILPQKLSIVCLEDGAESSEIVGLNLLMHCVKGNSSDDDNNEPKDLSRILLDIESQCDVFQTFKVEEYLGACGIAVNPKYRGFNIAAEILSAREPICKEMGLKVSQTTFTAVGSQVLAAKVGFKLLKEIKYDDLGERLNVKFPQGLHSAKVMVKEYD